MRSTCLFIETSFLTYALPISSLPNDSKSWQLLQVKGEVESEPSFEESCDGF